METVGLLSGADRLRLRSLGLLASGFGVRVQPDVRRGWLSHGRGLATGGAGRSRTSTSAHVSKPNGEAQAPVMSPARGRGVTGQRCLLCSRGREREFER